jgi:hypothetical protein
MSVIQDVIEDLRFYEQMNLTPISIELGPLAYKEVCMAHLVLSDSESKMLLGIPLKVVSTVNGWARGYRFKETSASVYSI